jgi:hypothetical protein
LALRAGPICLTVTSWLDVSAGLAGTRVMSGSPAVSPNVACNEDIRIIARAQLQASSFKVKVVDCNSSPCGSICPNREIGGVCRKLTGKLRCGQFGDLFQIIWNTGDIPKHDFFR